MTPQPFKGELPASIFQPDEVKARNWWATLTEPEQEERIYDLTQVLEFYGIDLPDSDERWMMACWENEFA
ncbi:hypothetical protein F8A10_12790 [Paracoccus kondratievae]|uniref:hypothetical protein n=1 Tax=Paracoccus kondratievae TaxID=135740 RepID=UPI0012663F51|nr:hypothetical protein [Paracoccus kondratievae]QFQ88372.1 hypothetical protein F8A10_12790 [Paracoccus kondratievae]